VDAIEERTRLNAPTYMDKIKIVKKTNLNGLRGTGGRRAGAKKMAWPQCQRGAPAVDYPFVRGKLKEARYLGNKKKKKGPGAKGTSEEREAGLGRGGGDKTKGTQPEIVDIPGRRHQTLTKKKGGGRKARD